LRAVGTIFTPSWAYFALKMPKIAYLRAENQGFFVEIRAMGDLSGLGGQDRRRNGRN
jgi:hypothetical protein